MNMSFVSEYIRQNIEQPSYRHLSETQNQLQSSASLIDTLSELRQSSLRRSQLDQKIQRVEHFLAIKQELIDFNILTQGQDRIDCLIASFFQSRTIRGFIDRQKDNLKILVAKKISEIFTSCNNQQQVNELREYLRVLKNLKQMHVANQTPNRQYVLQSSSLSLKCQSSIQQFKDKVKRYNREIMLALNKCVQYEEKILKEIQNMLIYEETTSYQMDYTPMKQIENEAPSNSVFGTEHDQQHEVHSQKNMTLVREQHRGRYF